MASTPTIRATVPTAPLAAGCGLAALAAYVAAVDPSSGGVFVPCPVHTLTGWWCPGCGLTRATHHLLHGEISTALRYNVLAPAILVAFVAGWAAWTLTASGCRVRWSSPRRAWPTAAALALVVAFGVLRNLPWFAGLRG